METRTKAGQRQERILVAHRATPGQKHHWFGCYDKCPWNATGRYLLCLEADFANRPPTAEDAAKLLMLDLAQEQRPIVLGQTTAWNWQMGTMLQWFPSAPDRLIIYNVRRRDGYGSVIQDVFTGEQKTFHRPVYGVSRNGKFAMTLDFERLADTRPGYGHIGIPDPGRDKPHPDSQGIYFLELQTDRSELVISLERIVRIEPEASFQGAKHWFNHLLVNQDNSRFIFLRRWTKAPAGWYTRLFTARPDDTDIVLVNRQEMTSHFDYRSPREILAYARQFDTGDHYYLFNDATGERRIIGECLFEGDGHCSYSPDRRWILTDTYPDRQRMRRLILYHVERNERIDIGKFFSPPEYSGELRCDLHPRWSRDGRQVCFDSVHEGSRQVSYGRV